MNYNLQRGNHRFLFEKAIHTIKQKKSEQFYAIKPSLNLSNFVAFNFSNLNKNGLLIMFKESPSIKLLNILNIEPFIITIASINYQIDLNVNPIKGVCVYLHTPR